MSLPIRSRSHARQEAERDDVRVFLIFWDEYHIDRMASALRSREALTNFVLTAFGPTDLVAFMEPMTPLDAIEFTRDRRQLAEQVRTLQGRRGIYVPPRNGAEEAHLSVMRDVERLRHEVTISAIKAAAVHLGAIRESRKDIIVVSEGFRGENDVMLDLIRAANASNAAIHIVDPRGLMVGGGRSMWMDSVSSETGGKTYRRNDIQDAMQEVVAASRAYYLLGYSPTNGARDGKYRKIQVRLKRGGVEVKARAGYWAPSLWTRSAPRRPPPPRACAAQRRAELCRSDAGDLAPRCGRLVRHVIRRRAAHRPRELGAAAGLARGRGRGRCQRRGPDGGRTGVRRARRCAQGLRLQRHAWVAPADDRVPQQRRGRAGPRDTEADHSGSCRHAARSDDASGVPREGSARVALLARSDSTRANGGARLRTR